MLEIKISPISIGLYHRFFVLLYSNQDDYFQNKKGMALVNYTVANLTL